jgi:hypothetical protein
MFFEVLNKKRDKKGVRWKNREKGVGKKKSVITN